MRADPTPNKLLAGLFVFFLIASVGTALLTYAVVRDAVASWRSNDRPEAPEEALLPASPEEMAEELGESGNQPLQPENRPPPHPWDGSSRVSVLVVGLDYRDWEEGGGAPRTDTMILLSLDPAYRSIGMLSIPRDLWVEIPGFEPAKINMAYRLGEIYDVPGGGPGLAMQTVTDVLGMPVDYYVQVDFYAFEGFIDEIGGVKVNVPEEIVVDPLGDNNTKVLKPGVQVLPGSLALAYARARNTAGSDFDRAQRQHQVILGVRDRILDSDMLPLLIRKSPILYDTLASGIHTNLTLMQIIRMAWIAQQVPEENIKSGVIGPNQVAFATSFDGQDILQPLPEEIRLLRDEIFTPTGPAIPAATQANPLELLQAEGATVSILNATTTPGLASRTAEYLKSQGLQAVEPGNAGELRAETSLTDYTGNPNTVQFLVDALGIPPEQIHHEYDASSEADVVVVLGADWASSNPMP